MSKNHGIIKANRAFILSDTHLGARSNSIEWLEMMHEWIMLDFIPKVKKEYKPGDILIHCGDVFDNRQSVNLLVLHNGISIFEELSKIFVDGIYVIAGNHDVMRKTTNDVSSLDSLKYIPNVHIFKEPLQATIKTNSRELIVLFMPWRTSEKEERSCIKEYETWKCEYLFCHTNIRNLSFDKYRKVDEGIGKSDLVKFKQVYSGHIHWQQKRENITMIGNPYQMTRSDLGNKKGWYILDFDDGSSRFIENDFSPKFIKVYINEWIEKPFSELKSLCKKNRVDLYIPTSYLVKFDLNPIIDGVSKICKKLEIITFEDEDYNESSVIIDTSSTYNIYDLCKKHVNELNAYDDAIKKNLLKKLNTLYLESIK